MCNQQFTRAIPAHNFNEGVVAVEPTCTEVGTMKYTCKDCGATKTEDIKALGHDLQDVKELVPATCEKTGLSEKVCSRCGYEEKTVLKALGHKVKGTAHTGYIDAKGEVQGDTSKDTENPDPCSYDTVKIYECDHYTTDEKNRCNLKDGKVVETVKKATGHAIDTSKEVREGIATIDLTKVVDEKGVYDYSKVDYVRDDNGKIVFEKGAVVDCSHEKVKIFSCANCDKEEVVVVVEERKAHTGAVTTKPATCEDYGYTSTSCTVCNKVVVEKTAEKPVGHNYVYNAETCTTPAVIKCTRCNDELTVDEISTLNSGEDSTLKEKITKLLKDAKVLQSSETLANFKAYNPALGHNFVGKLTVDKDDPTKGTSYCDRCGKNIQVDIDLAVDEEIADKNITMEEEASGNEEKVSDRMGLVDIETTVDENDKTKVNVSIKLKSGKESDLENNKIETPNGNCFGIMLDLGIKAKDVKIISKGYIFNPDGSDTDLTQMKRWNKSANENCFMIWLSPEDFEANGGTYKITFADSSNPDTYPITVTFTYAVAEA